MHNKSFEEELFAFAVSNAQTFEAKRGELLQAPMAKKSPIYLILKGTAHAFIDQENGRQTIRLGYPGELLSALPGFFLGTPSALGIEAIKHCKGYKLHRHELEHFVQHNKNIQSSYISMLEAFTCGLMTRELDLLEPSPQRRFDNLMQRSPHVFQHIPLRYIASYLRMSPETLSRIRAKS